MKILLQFISRLFYQFGFTIQINNIIVRDFNEIKDVLTRFKINNDIKSYTDFLDKYTETNYKRIRFIGSGGGQGTTQTHSIVKNKDDYLFEKVFNVKSYEFRSLKINYDYIKNELKKRDVEIPDLLNIFETEVLGVCHFAYIPNLEVIKEDDINYKMGLLKKLWEVPYRSSFDQGDYQQLTIIKTKLTDLFFQLLNKPSLFHFLNIKQFVDVQNKVFTHADFYKRNIFKNYLIDWDEAGFYPFGLDLATTLCEVNIYKDKKLSVQDVFKKLDAFTLTKSEKIGVVYFFIIFSTSRINNNIIERWIEELYNETIIVQKGVKLI